MARYADALADYDRAVDLRTALVEQEGQAEWADDLAGSLAARGTAYRSLTRYDEALRDLDRAVSIRRRLVEKEGRRDLRSGERGVGTGWGGGVTAMGREGVSVMGGYADGVAEYARAVDLRTALVEREGHAEWADDLAGSLAARGTAYRSLTRYDEALRDLDRAVSIRRRLVEKEGRRDL